MGKSMLMTSSQRVLTLDCVFRQLLYYICFLGGEKVCTYRLCKLSPILIESLRDRFEDHCQEYAHRVSIWRDAVISQPRRLSCQYSFNQMQDMTRLFQLEDMFEAFTEEYLAEFWPQDPQTHSVKKDLDYHILGNRTRYPTDVSVFVDGHLLINPILEKSPSRRKENQTTSDRTR
jgi:hypothetical protein